MTVSKDLMYAILSMDSYNRGYGAGINLSDAKGEKIGTAEISKRIQDIDGFEDAAVNAGFYAAAYTYDGGTVISYRGTDFELR